MVLIAAAVGVISMFLPWTSFAGFTASGMRGGGIIVFICFLAAGFLSFTGDQTTNLNRMNWMLTLIAGAIAFLIAVINFFDAPKAIIGFGLYIALAASIGVLAFAYMHRSASDSLQGGFDSLKGEVNRRTATTSGNTTATTTNVSHPTTNDTTRPTA